MIKKQESDASVPKAPKVIPLGDRVLIKPLSLEDLGHVSKHGIIIPETVDKEKPEQGEVLAVGAGRFENGKTVPMKVKVGDRVLFSKYGYDEVKIGETEYYILKEDSLLAIIK